MNLHCCVRQWKSKLIFSASPGQFPHSDRVMLASPEARLLSGRDPTRATLPITRKKNMLIKETGQFTCNRTSRTLDKASWIQHARSWIPDQDPGILNRGSRILGPGSKIQEAESWIQDAPLHHPKPNERTVSGNPRENFLKFKFSKWKNNALLF